MISLLMAAVYSQCIIQVPDNPLTAEGLATPYLVTGCDQTDPTAASFVEGAIFDPATNQISMYNPLAINKGSKPAIVPTVPTLPPNAIVGIWFGSNSENITLKNNVGIAAGSCTNGLGKGDIFGQMAFCNAAAFMQAAKNVTTVPLGTTTLNDPCPTTRDFSIIDQDQSDNVVTKYILKNGQLAQNTAANLAALNATATDIISNGSDNALLLKILGVLGCAPNLAPDLADANALVGSLALNEISAHQNQVAPAATIPLNDPMVLLADGNTSVEKADLYRAAVLQGPVDPIDNHLRYCRNFGNIAPPRIQKEMSLTTNSSSPKATVGSNLFTFLAARFVTSFGPEGLNCTGLGFVSPVNVTLDTTGVAIDAAFTTFNPNSNVINLVAPNRTRVPGNRAVNRRHPAGPRQNVTAPQSIPLAPPQNGSAPNHSHGVNARH